MRKQLKTSGYLKPSKVWSEPWNPRRQPTAQEERQQQQRNWIDYIQQTQLENECKWELKQIQETYKRKKQEFNEEIDAQR